MDTNQTNRTTMFRTVSFYLNENISIWNGMQPLVTAVLALNEKIAEIEAAAMKQETPRGATEQKAAAREALEDVVFFTCEALGVLGHTGSDHELSAITSVTRTTLRRMTEDELSRRADSVLVEANARKAELVAMQVTQANLDELTQALQDFNTSKTNPRQAAVERMTQTQSLPILIRETNTILREQIDRLVSLFARTNPGFVAGYKAARVIVDRAATHTPAQTKTGSTASNL